ncbi:MAG: N-acetyl-gamma-glutamyl-phosphate reductase [Gaiellales bacterium]
MVSNLRSRRATLTAGIAGASGYAGHELMRLLDGHPALRAVEHPAEAGSLAGCDIALLALPHDASGPVARELEQAGTPVVDLSRDLRGDWPYGLPELHRDDLAGATAVANPGCYATAAALALAPLAVAGAIEPHVVVDGKSGVSGAGKSPSRSNVFCQAAEGIAAYAPVGHPHQEEIERELSEVGGAPLTVTFTPHLAPFIRGLLVTAYARLALPLTQAGVDELYRAAYAGEPFVNLVAQPRTQAVRGSNLCQVAAWVDERRGAVVVCAAIDNLVKGAAGQAIQNANLMLGLPETQGLPASEVWP